MEALYLSVDGLLVKNSSYHWKSAFNGYMKVTHQPKY